jgi:AcrR family transcriptional regulator
MSPYPSQVNREMILQMARELIEAEGYERLTLKILADALGISAPSLYRYFKSKTELLQAVNTATIEQLVDALRSAVAQMDDDNDDSDPSGQFLAMARAYREFAFAHPVAYSLAYSSTLPELRIDAQHAEALVLPIQAIMAKISGDEDSLTALRGALAMLHGFVTLELAGQFRRGGDLSEAFARSVEAYLDGWRQAENPKRHVR